MQTSFNEIFFISAIFFAMWGILEGSFNFPLLGTGDKNGQSVSSIIFDNSISLITDSIYLFPKVIFPVNDIKQPFEIIFFANSKSYE